MRDVLQLIVHFFKFLNSVINICQQELFLDDLKVEFFWQSNFNQANGQS